jgi:ferredoxin-NADP reductase
MNVTFLRADDEGGGIKTFWFRPERPVRYTAGQFTEIFLPHTGADGRGERRWFTLSSSPTQPDVSVTTKFVRGGAGSSFKQHLLALAPGAALKLADPLGDFVLPKDSSTPLVFVAAGLGITPVHSMVQYLADRGEKRPVTLLYAVGRAEELAFAPLFDQYNMRFVPIVKRPDADWQGETGSLTTDRIMQLAGPDDGRRLVYLSGPEVMVEQFAAELPARGLPAERLITDYFHGYRRI